MEEILDSSKATNNNIIDDLAALKEDQQLNVLNQIEVIKDQTASDQLVDGLLKSDKVDSQSNDAKVDLVDLTSEADKSTSELISDLTKPTESATDNQLLSELIESATESTNELTESTKQLIEDLNDTANTNMLDLTSSAHNRTDETSLEQARENVTDHLLIDNLLEDCSVKETHQLVDQATESLTLDSTQDSINQETYTTAQLSNDDKTQENLLEELGLDNSKQDTSLDESCKLIIDESTGPQDSTNESLNDLMDVSKDSLDQSSREAASSCSHFNLMDQSPIESETSKQESLKVEVNDSSFLKDITNQLEKSVDDFLTEVKPAEISLDQRQANEQTRPLEDFVAADVYEAKAVLESNADKTSEQLGKSETFIVHKTEELKIADPKDAIYQLNKEDSIKEEHQAHKVTKKDEPIDEISEITELISEDPISKSKEDVFSQSHEIFMQTDKLIAEKKSSLVTEINIPGLDVSAASEQSNEPQSASQESAKQNESAKPDTSAQPASEEVTGKAKKTESKRCIIS